MSLKTVPDELVLGQMRDWNEELQTARQLPTNTSAAKVFRDRALFKIHSDFVQACTRGSVAVVDGYLPSLNPGDEPKFRMYMWNNIFFSLAFNGRNHYKDFGGDSAAHVAASLDLQGVAAFERLMARSTEPKGLHTLGTVLVDYRGYRVVCQSIIPGLLQREHDSAVVYGSIDTGKNVCIEEHFVELLKKMAEELHIREHKVRTMKNAEVLSLPSSLEVKGIIGNDRRYYVLDLFRIFPPDANFMDLPEGAKFRHKMAVLRPEFLDTFLSYKFMQFLRLIKDKADKLKKQTPKPDADTADTADPANTSDTTDASNSADTASKADAASKADTASTTDATNTTDAADSASKADTANTGDGANSADTSDTADAANTTDAKDNVGHGSSGDSTSPSTDSVAKCPVHHTDSSDTTDTTNAQENSARSIKAESSATPTPEASPSKCPAHSLASLRPPAGTRTGISALAPPVPSTKTSLLSCHQPPTQEKGAEEGEGLASDPLYLLDSRSLVEEKEVGPDIPKGLADEDISAMRESEADPKNQLAGRPEVATAFVEALKEAGSTSLEEFVIKFNVDIHSPGVDHADDEEVLEKDRTLVAEASQFLVESVVPRFVRDCIQLTVTPVDGEALTVAMHARGINMRYLGEVAALAALREDLEHLRCLCLSEMIVRLSKRKLRVVLQETPNELTSEAISHFLNCLLADPKEGKDEQLSNGHAKKKKKKKAIRGQKVASYLKLTNEKLWHELVEEMEVYYRYKITYPSLSELCVQTEIRKLSLLRGVCKHTGVQILLRDYDFTANPVFTDDDIVATFPIVSHTDFRPMEPTALYEVALSKFSVGQLQLAHELFADCLQLFVQVYGPMHLDNANCYRHLARIEYMLNDAASALSNQHKATLILERVLGVDHPETITAYIDLALHSNANNQPAAALRLLYRARYLLLLLFGEDHPEMATCDSNIAIILHSIKDYKNSLCFLSNTLAIHNKYHGVESLQVAMTHHLLARVHSFLGDFRAAISHEKTTFSIYQKKLGADHDKTKESSQCLKELTAKAVTMQKTINEMTSKGSSGEKVLVDLPGSWGEVVGMMNAGSLDPRHQQHLRPKPHVTRKKPKKAKTPSSPNSGQNLP